MANPVVLGNAEQVRELVSILLNPLKSTVFILQ